MFSSPVRLEVRSPVDDLIDALPEELRKRGELLLGDRRLALDGLRLEEKLRLPGEACVFLRSPVTAHQTLPGGKTRFFSPEEPEWQDRLGDNLRAKLSALGMEPAPAFSITALDTVPKKQVIRFKETYITGYLGSFRIKTGPEAMAVLYHWGLGNRNSQGFGLFDIVDEKGLFPGSPRSGLAFSISHSAPPRFSAGSLRRERHISLCGIIAQHNSLRILYLRTKPKKRMLPTP